MNIIGLSPLGRSQLISLCLPDVLRPLCALRLVVLCVGIELLGFAFSGGYSAGGIAGIVLGKLCVYCLVRLAHRGINWARWVLAAIIVLG